MNMTQSAVLSRQAPLRAAYAQHPETALIHKHVHTGPADSRDALHGSVIPGDSYGQAWKFGIDRAVGGFHDAPNPGEILCAALATCQHSTVCMIADVMGVQLDHVEVEVTGDVDVRGCLAMDASVPVAFRSMEMRVRLQPAVGTAPDLVKRLIERSEALSINLATLRKGVPVRTAFAAQACD